MAKTLFSALALLTCFLVVGVSPSEARTISREDPGGGAAALRSSGSFDSTRGLDLYGRTRSDRGYESWLNYSVSSDSHRFDMRMRGGGSAGHSEYDSSRSWRSQTRAGTHSRGLRTSDPRPRYRPSGDDYGSRRYDYDGDSDSDSDHGYGRHRYGHDDDSDSEDDYGRHRYDYDDDSDSDSDSDSEHGHGPPVYIPHEPYPPNPNPYPVPEPATALLLCFGLAAIGWFGRPRPAPVPVSQERLSASNVPPRR